MGEGNAKLLWVVALILFVGTGVVLGTLDPMYRAINPPPPPGESTELMVQLPAQFVVASMTGFKEVIAGALWVRADSFFHEGQYQAIVPIVRLVTWLDPHNLDVYTTGAWHLDYNFVDQGQMSDKRYIPGSIALLKEGIKQNPRIWDLYFELGWTHYNKKLQDYQKGLEYIKKACALDGIDANTGAKTPRPEYVDRMLAHQYERLGMFKEAVEQWHKARQRIVDELNDKNDKSARLDQSSLDVCDRNLYLLYLRQAYRYGDMDAYRKGVEIAQRLASDKHAPADVVATAKFAAADYAKRLAANNPPHDIAKPLDAGFQVTWKKVAPKIFLIKGKLNLIPTSEYKDLASEGITHFYRDNEKANANVKKAWRDGCRVRWMICDYDYERPELQTFSWKLDTTKTIVWDSVYVGGGTFSERIDLSQDPEFYPFMAEKYKLVITVTPQQPDVPDYVQDRIGWKGEALTDRHYLDTKTQPGFRILRKEVILTRKDVL